MVKRRRKTRTHLKGPNNSASSSTSAPKSFIIRSGKVPKPVTGLVQDVRKTMEPNTATRLRERKTNKLKDFISMAGPLGVTHLLIFGQTDSGTNLRIMRAPRGPTLTFRINKYALAKDILTSARRPRAPGNEFVTPPLLVLNNFGGEEKHVKLLVATFQNLFPPIQVQTMKLSQARRIVLLNYNSATGTIDWRHYLISVRPVGVSKTVRRVVEGTRTSKSRALPDMSSAQDIADYVLGQRASASAGGEAEFETDASEAESEAEDMADPKNKVELHDKYIGRGNSANTQKAVRLKEIGPRMELRLVKIEEGVNDGAVLYHEYIKKSAKESVAQYREHQQKKKLAEERRAEQEANVERKKIEREQQKRASRRAAGLPSDSEEASDEEEDGEDAGIGKDDSDDEEEDEFAYEDQFGEPDQDGTPNGDDNDEELFDDDREVSEEEDEEEDDDEGDADSLPLGNDRFNNPPGVTPETDESDLEPIPLGSMQHDYDSNEEWPEFSDDDVGEEVAVPKKAKRSIANGNTGKAKGRQARR